MPYKEKVKICNTKEIVNYIIIFKDYYIFKELFNKERGWEREGEKEARRKGGREKKNVKHIQYQSRRK